MLITIFVPIETNKTLIIYSNLILFLVNLIPVYPLDGGRILKNILHMKIGYFEACKITNAVSNIITIILTVLASLSIISNVTRK